MLTKVYLKQQKTNDNFIYPYLSQQGLPHRNLAEDWAQKQWLEQMWWPTNSIAEPGYLPSLDDLFLSQFLSYEIMKISKLLKTQMLSNCSMPLRLYRDCRSTIASSMCVSASEKTNSLVSAENQSCRPNTICTQKKKSKKGIFSLSLLK